MPKPKARICFVCLGNICRSPTAEGIMRHLLEQEGLLEAIALDSAGVGSWHVGKSPDSRARRTAKGRGYTLQGRARQFQPGDFERFDYVLAMDAQNRADLEDMAPDAAARRKIHMLRDFDPQGRGEDVPDPYYGGADGFERVFDICERACRGLLDHIRSEHGVG